MLGDSVTTDHISPAGSIRPSSPAGSGCRNTACRWPSSTPTAHGAGNHEVMIRGTFANPRIRNLLVAGTEGGVTLHLPDGEQMTIFDAVGPLPVRGRSPRGLAGKEYGSGSSRDWAAKGPALLGVRAVLAESFERIHRSNLIGMGVLPLQFAPGENAWSLLGDGHEVIEIDGALRGGRGQPRGPRAHGAGRRAPRTGNACGSTPPARPSTCGTEASSPLS